MAKKKYVEHWSI